MSHTFVPSKKCDRGKHPTDNPGGRCEYCVEEDKAQRKRDVEIRESIRRLLKSGDLIVHNSLVQIKEGD